MAQKLQLQDGDMVRFDYSLFVGEEERPVDTSMEEVAKEYNIVQERKHYTPIALTLGRNQVIPGLERHIREYATVGEKLSVKLPPDDAYGQRDASKIQDLPMAEFRKQKVKPEVGMQVNLKDGRGVIIRVAGGRVRVDLNHELAGKDLRYDYILRDVITEPQEKLEASLQNVFPYGGYELDYDGETVTLEVPDQAKFDQNWPMHKFRLLSELRQVVGADKTIRLTETFPGDEPSSEEE